MENIVTSIKFQALLTRGFASKHRTKNNQNINSNRRYQYSSLPSDEPSTSSDYFSQKSSQFSVKKLTYRKSSDVHESEAATELTKLRARTSASNLKSYTSETQRPPPPDDVVYLEREILPTDSLQSFALLYGCTVAEIKRANNLITEQDFFALRHIKIPVKRHGILTEPSEESKRRSFATTSLGGCAALAQSAHHASKTITVNGEAVSERFVVDTTSDVYTNCNGEVESGDSIENVSLMSTDSTTQLHLHKNFAVERNDTNKYLKKVDKEIRKTVRKNDELQSDKNEVLEEVVSSIGSVAYRPLLPPGSKADDCDGADWGFKWWAVLLTFAVVLLLLIFILVEYYVAHEHSSDTSLANSPPT